MVSSIAQVKIEAVVSSEEKVSSSTEVSREAVVSKNAKVTSEAERGVCFPFPLCRMT